MRSNVRFMLNGAHVDLEAPDPTGTLLEWLRCDQRLTGTKEGCAEGDCGACSVMVVDPAGKARIVNSCIQFVPMLDDCAVTTIEGISSRGALSLLQHAMIDKHGSQCGFCTPGFVMALHTHHARGGSSERAAISEAIAGNLCRCTGYGPILEAGEAMRGMDRKPLPELPVTDSVPLGYTWRDAHGKSRSFHAPTTLDAMAAFLEQHTDAVVLAGATDIGLWVTKKGKRPAVLVSVSRVAELQAITQSGDGIEIGAGVRYADALETLSGLHPSLREYLRRLGAAQVRDSGTIIGNIANGSPIGDMPPVLIALGATIRLRHGSASRELPLEQFFLDYGKQDRAPGEFLTHVTIPELHPNVLFAAEKISKRFEQDISAVSAGLYVELDAGAVSNVRLAFGGMAGVPRRAAAAEAALMGQPWSETAIKAAMRALANDFQPLTDARGTSQYRIATAQQLLLRFFQENVGASSVRVRELRSIAHG